MLSKPFSFLCLLFLVPLDGPGAQGVVLPDTAGSEQSGQPNTWSAKTRSGRTLAGTWTATVDSTSGDVSGRWTLVNAQGSIRASGGWAAAKSPTEWTGGWRAVMYGSTVEYSGVWSATVDLKAQAPFADLFETALRTVVSGKWWLGRQSGPWSIRAYK